MANKRIKLTEQDILSRVNLPLLPGDIVTHNTYFPQSDVAEHYKILSIYNLEVPYKDDNRPPKLETWANVEIVRSPKTPAAVGVKMKSPIFAFRRVSDRTLGDYLKDRKDRGVAVWPI